MSTTAIVARHRGSLQVPDGALIVEKAMYKAVFLYAWCTNACLLSFIPASTPPPFGVCQYHCLRIDVYQSHDLLHTCK